MFYLSEEKSGKTQIFVCGNICDVENLNDEFFFCAIELQKVSFYCLDVSTHHHLAGNLKITRCNLNANYYS